MKLYKMIEIYLKYDNMHTFGIINTFICINTHINSCINNMLSVVNCTRSRVKIKSKLTNLMKTSQIEGYNGK